MSNAIVRLALYLLVIAFPFGAMAQHNHSTGHDVYMGWKNQKDEGCCNGQDCGALTEVEERTTNGKTEVLVGFGSETKEWCPVIESYHTLKQPARSPDYSKSHACVVPPSYGGSVCQRFRCYMGRPLT